VGANSQAKLALQQSAALVERYQTTAAIILGQLTERELNPTGSSLVILTGTGTARPSS